MSPTRRLRLSVPTTPLIRTVFLDEQDDQRVLEDPMDDLQLRIWVETVLPHDGAQRRPPDGFRGLSAVLPQEPDRALKLLAKAVDLGFGGG